VRALGGQQDGAAERESGTECVSSAADLAADDNVAVAIQRGAVRLQRFAEAFESALVGEGKLHGNTAFNGGVPREGGLLEPILEAVLCGKDARDWGGGVSALCHQATDEDLDGGDGVDNWCNGVRNTMLQKCNGGTDLSCGGRSRSALAARVYRR
jgi:hypothetical protein